jgi:hypothetical protein
MAKRLLTVLFLTVLLPAYAATGEDYVQGEFMPLEQADKSWGHTAFSELKFKKASPDQRAALIVDLIRSKKLEGARLQTVRKLLGPPDGYFLDDSIPAYLLGSRKPGEKKDVWQIIFIPNEERTKVIEIKIHKNCCYKED